MEKSKKVKIEVDQLHPLEIMVLFSAGEKESINNVALQPELSLLEGQINQALSWLTLKGLVVEIRRTTETLYERTECGNNWSVSGIPARRMMIVLRQTDRPLTLKDMPILIIDTLAEVGRSFGILSKAGVLRFDNGRYIKIIDEDLFPQELVILENLVKRERHSDFVLSEQEKGVISRYSKKRGTGGVPFRRSERETVFYTLTKEGREYLTEAQSRGMSGPEENALTQKMLQNKTWKGKKFRVYNISLPPNRVSVGRQNSYTQFLQQVKDKLVSLGFEEFDGSLVQTEFWNSDALFMPQFHSARDIHDVYYLNRPTHAKKIEEPWFSNVAKVHENGGGTGSRGWQYPFDKDFAKRLILRSQGTVMSARTLPTAKIPGKYFGVLRVFRRDQIDATHLSDFFQTEGIILGDDVNLRTLLGLLRVFAEEIANAKEVRYVPGYFPFTEPSIEVHVKHPEMGWMELGGSGILRPEVTKPLGINVPVAAWGVGIDRMATMQMGIKDIRELFTYDLEKVLLRKSIVR